MKLEGLTVIDLSSLLPGPLLTGMMADHGATVIKIEAPEGDPSRAIAPRDDGFSSFFRNLNRGKRSLRLNLKHPQGREILLRLARTADVLLEGFRPGVARRLGVDYEALAPSAPSLVYCSLSAFGQDGPYRDKPAHDLAVAALAGIGALNLGRDGKPALPALPMSDIAAAQMALSGILMALLRRAQTGRGDYLDMAMYDALLACTPSFSGPALAHEPMAEPASQRIWGGLAFYNVYETSDGGWIALAGPEPKFAAAFLEKAGRLDLLPHAEQPAGGQEPLTEWLRDAFRGRTLAQWLDWLRDVQVCYAPFRTLAEALEDEHIRARGMVLEDDAGRRQLGVPIRFREEPARPDLRPPRLGEHSREIAAGLGYSAAQIEALVEQDVL